MNILMLTNIYTPLVGGITRSIQSFAAYFRQHGHRVLIVAPDAGGTDPAETDVLRYPAIPNAYQNKYALPLPVPGLLSSVIRDFKPDVMHTHHPFLLGTTAQRQAVLANVPLVYTHHTRYDIYLDTHTKVPGGVKQIFLNLWANYCNLCDAVVAPSGSVSDVLRGRGVTTPIEVIPTGIEADHFARRHAWDFRADLGIPDNAFVVGHLGRLSAEKNCAFLARSVAAFLAGNGQAHFLLAGDGPCRKEFEELFRERGVFERAHFLGFLDRDTVPAAYQAMDAFAFASYSETQGMVVTEALAAGLPVVALDAPGVSDVVRDGHNGRLLPGEDADAFAAALEGLANNNGEERQRLRQAARAAAAEFSVESCAEKTLALYQRVAESRALAPEDDNAVARTLRVADYEWRTWSTLIQSVARTILVPEPGDPADLMVVRGARAS